MTIDTDGNLAALRAYEREQDLQDQADRALEEAKQSLADDLFDAYHEDNQDVILEVEDFLMNEEHANTVLAALRNNLTRDGVALRTNYIKAVGQMLEDFVHNRGFDTLDEIEQFRSDFKL